MLKSRDRPLPEPSYMSKEQTAQYLSDLRRSQPARPSGSRPPPPSSRPPRSHRTETEPVIPLASTDQASVAPSLSSSNSMPLLPAPYLAHRQKEPVPAATNPTRKSPFAGRPLARAPSSTANSITTSTDAEESKHAVRKTPSMTYRESGTRWMEKQEVRSLRSALEDMDREEERRIHRAAQDEAAELVWQHRNPHAPFVNPDIRTTSAHQDHKDYRAHLRKGSYQRSMSVSSESTGGRRAASGGSHQSASGDEDGHEAMASPREVIPRKASPPAELVSVQKRRSTTDKSYDSLAQAVASDIAKAQRRISSGGGGKRIPSSEKKFMHPQDRIWEDPQEELTPKKKMIGQTIVEEDERAGMKRADSAPIVPVPSLMRKNPFARVRMQSAGIERSQSTPILPRPAAPTPKVDRFEIQRNPPSQSRNPWYTSNDALPPTPPSTSDSGEAEDETRPKHTPTKDGREIRGDDIRAATSKARNDYSPKLPRPTVVSDKPGRPIVSFQKDWQAKEPAPKVMQSPAAPSVRQSLGHPHVPRPISASSFMHRPMSSPSASSQKADSGSDNRPSIPVINFPDSDSPPIILLPDNAPSQSPGHYRSASTVPAISIDVPSVIPTIAVSDNISSTPAVQRNAAQSQQQRPLPQPTAAPALPHHPRGVPASPPKSSLHYSPSIQQSGALCTHCALPIAGRILSAAGRRFHPGCFVCYACRTNLECVAFYPEPEKTRDQRRADADAADHAADDLRFYCHLDFHELFSPRCKSCRTPIEGEVVMACGAEWHPGHFFCAQCGDPFDATMPFVERDGYAWCVGCHTNRYSPKCRGCRKPVTDVVVKALGKEWHAGCFVCVECRAEFDDGRYFLRGESEDPVCVKCEERRLKA